MTLKEKLIKNLSARREELIKEAKERLVEGSIISAIGGIGAASGIMMIKEEPLNGSILLILGLMTTILGVNKSKERKDLKHIVENIDGLLFTEDLSEKTLLFIVQDAIRESQDNLIDMVLDLGLSTKSSQKSMK